MTVEDRYIVELNDIRLVRLECGACGATVSFRPRDWHRVPTECPGCRAMFHHDTGTLPVSAVVALSNALRNALAVVPNLPFKLQLEMDRPKS